MAINFPNSPAPGDKHPVTPIPGVPNYIWDGEKWSTTVSGSLTAAPPSLAVPQMDGTAATGSEDKYSRGDHVHPSDTSRASFADLALKADKTYVDSQDATKANKSYVDTQDATKAPLASPAFTGSPTAPTPTAGNSSTGLATTEFVGAALATVAAVKRIKTTTFVNNGTFVPDPSMIYCMMEVVGGGGGGGCGQSSSGWGTSGGGGAGGNYGRSYFTKAEVAENQFVTIGVSGALGNPGAGDVGGLTTIGALISANGGGGGGPSGSGNGGYCGSPNAGLAKGSAQLLVLGDFGGPGVGAPAAQVIASGIGGRSMLGPGTAAIVSGGPTSGGSGHPNTGGGGGGGISYNGGAGQGGSGSAGKAIITEYCSA